MGSATLTSWSASEAPSACRYGAINRIQVGNARPTVTINPSISALVLRPAERRRTNSASPSIITGYIAT